jgi:hypothetical protein
LGGEDIGAEGETSQFTSISSSSSSPLLSLSEPLLCLSPLSLLSTSALALPALFSPPPQSSLSRPKSFFLSKPPKTSTKYPTHRPDPARPWTTHRGRGRRRPMRHADRRPHAPPADDSRISRGPREIQGRRRHRGIRFAGW